MAAPGFIGYGVTCGATETFSRILAGELSESGIRVVASDRAGATTGAIANLTCGSVVD